VARPALPARCAIVIAAGAVVCTLCDHMHVAFGVLLYARPAVWQQAWWVPLLFAASSASVLVGVVPTRALFGGEPWHAPQSAAPIVTAGALFVLAYAFTAVAHAFRDVVLVALLSLWVLRVAKGVPRWLFAYSLIVAVLGPSVEATLSSLGLFVYRAPDFLGVPRWLPALYLHAGLVASPVAHWAYGVGREPGLV
jgi:hypothetical protein